MTDRDIRVGILRNLTATLRGRRPANDMPCRDVVDIVTSYLEGDLEPALRARFGAHLAACADCVLYVDQMRQTIEISGAAGESQELPPAVREHLRVVFEDWVRTDSAG